MKLTKVKITLLSVIGLMLIAFGAGAMPHDVTQLAAWLPAIDDNQLMAGMMLAGTVGDKDAVMKMMDQIEKSINDFQVKAKREIAETSKVSTETKNALDTLGEKQKELADEILLLKQKSVADGVYSSSTNKSLGLQVVNHSAFSEVMSGDRQKARFEIQNNTVTGSDTTVAPDRRPGVVPGAFTPLKIEDLFAHIPTGSNMVEYTRENVFTNAAAETAEGVAKPESSETFTLVQAPVATVAHWLKISKQLAADNAALVAYINERLMWGVQRRVDTQLISGNGTSPNISGLLNAGNYTVHGYTAAQVGTPLPKHRLIRMVISDLRAAGYSPNAILLNPADWLQFDLDLMSSTPAALSSGDIANGFQPMLFGVPVIESNAVTADTFAVVDTVAAASIYDRQAVMVEMSESDSDNFTKNLITVRAERRLALGVEQVAAIRGGDLTPA